MRYSLRWDLDATQDLHALPKNIKTTILDKVEWFCKQIDPLHFAKPLSGKLRDLYRFRIGDYRAVFEIFPDGEIRILNILSVKHRKDVYR